MELLNGFKCLDDKCQYYAIYEGIDYPLYCEFPLIASSKMVLIPFLLKLSPDPTSRIMMWLGYLSEKYLTC
jgi:hypothetical protein